MIYTTFRRGNPEDVRRGATRIKMPIALLVLAAILAVPAVASAYSDLESFAKVAPKIAERASDDYGKLINIAALLHDYDEKMILAVMVVESEGYSHAVSHRGALGLMQLMPATAKAMGAKDPKEPFQNILAGTKYLKELERTYGFSPLEALVAYNMGPTKAKRWLTQYKPEDSLYVQKVLRVYNHLVDVEQRAKVVQDDVPSNPLSLGSGIMTKPRTITLGDDLASAVGSRRTEIIEKN